MIVGQGIEEKDKLTNKLESQAQNKLLQISGADKEPSKQ